MLEEEWKKRWKEILLEEEIKKGGKIINERKDVRERKDEV